jgi:hypothetical protein
MQENMQENERLPLLGGVKIAPNNMITANRATVSKSKGTHFFHTCIHDTIN